MEKKIKAKVTNVYGNEHIAEFMEGINCELHIPDEDQCGYRGECYAICEIGSLQEFLDIIDAIGIEVIVSRSTSDIADVELEIYDNYRE